MREMREEPTWTSTVVEGNREEWLPLVEIGSSDTTMGVSRNGTWLIGNSNECVLLSSGRGRVRILPLLEDAEQTKQALARLLANQVVLPEGGLESPFLIAIATALTGHSEYWADLALSCLTIVRPSQEIVTALAKLVDARWLSQRVRHRARRFLRKETSLK